MPHTAPLNAAYLHTAAEWQVLRTGADSTIPSWAQLVVSLAPPLDALLAGQQRAAAMYSSEQAGSSSWTSAGKRKREVSDDGSVSATVYPQAAFALQKQRRVEVSASCHSLAVCHSTLLNS